MTTHLLHILVADDSIINLEILNDLLADTYTITTATNGLEAWSILEKYPNKFEALLLDRMMPKMDGMEVLIKMKQHDILKNCPVIIQTAKDKIADIAEGINAGAYYYLTKPFDHNLLLTIVKTAVRDYADYKLSKQSLNESNNALTLITSATFQYQTIEESRILAALISNICPKPQDVILGLSELLINAIEHGNLNIGYNEKSRLNDNGTLTAEITNRLNQEAYKHKKVTVQFEHHNHTIYITIIDEGLGFDWLPYMDFDTTRLMDNHGRGIAMANKLSFSQLEYKGKGNEVRATICCE